MSKLPFLTLRRPPPGRSDPSHKGSVFIDPSEGEILFDVGGNGGKPVVLIDGGAVPEATLRAE